MKNSNGSLTVLLLCQWTSRGRYGRLGPDEEMYWRRDLASTCIVYHLAGLKEARFDRREISICNVFFLTVTLFRLSILVRLSILDRLSVLVRLRCSRRVCGRGGVPLAGQRAERIPRAERREQ